MIYLKRKKKKNNGPKWAGDANMATDNRFSFKGWKFMEWLKGNWSTIKELLKVGAPLILGLQFFSANPYMVGVVTVVGKLILDTAQYYISK